MLENWFHLFDLNGIKCWIHFNNDVAFNSASLGKKKKTGMFLDSCVISFFLVFFFFSLSLSLSPSSGVLLVGTSLYSPHRWANRPANYPLGRVG